MTERELFEQWAYSNKWNIFRYPKSDYHLKEGQYCDEFVEGAWHGWQASANREGYKLVPVEPSDKMKLSAYKQYDTGLSSMTDIYKAMIGAVE